MTIRFLNRVLLAFMIGVFLAPAAFSQTFDRIERGRMKGMLKIVKAEVREKYYDPSYHGVDLENRFKQADEKLDLVTSTPQALAVIAQVLIDFNDSHLFFIPPSTNLAVEYGWRMAAIGDKVYVTQLKPGSDAEAKGLKVGDQILSISGFRPSKKELWKVRYYYNGLSKRSSLKLEVLGPQAEAPRTLEINSELKKLPQSVTFGTYFRLFDDFYEEENDKHRFQTASGVTVWRMPSFGYDPTSVGNLVGRFKDSRALILDLRGNGGGYVKTMEELVGYLFDKDIRISEAKSRKKTEISASKTKGSGSFKGKLIVLVDSDSGSASEVFARVVQLEGRGRIIGDTTAGAVMQSVQYEHAIGTDSIVPFSVSITNADVIMTDGKSLEHVGVVPDETVVPSATDLATGRDPALARAFDILGVKVTPEEAGKLFKYYWKKN
ncbi:MAG: S41 family peptidase [Pyrinomonadaceae bacterium]